MRIYAVALLALCLFGCAQRREGLCQLHHILRCCVNPSCYSVMAFIRKVKRNGKVYEYLVEGYRDADGKVKHRYLQAESVAQQDSVTQQEVVTQQPVVEKPVTQQAVTQQVKSVVQQSVVQQESVTQQPARSYTCKHCGVQSLIAMQGGYCGTCFAAQREARRHPVPNAE